MLSRLKTAKLIIKNKGLFALIKKVFKRYVFSFLCLPLCFVKIRKTRFKNLKELVNFVFDDCYGFLVPLQVKSEITSLLEFVKNIKPITIMEIGTAMGGTLFLFSKVIPKDSLLISCDLPRGDFGGGYLPWRVLLYKSFAMEKQVVRLIRGNSHNIKILQKIKNILKGRKLDFLFIDGDHTYEGVKRDFELYKRLVRRGGIIAFHDIAPQPPEIKCEVNKFWNEVKKKYKYKEFVENWGQGRAGIGLIEI